MITRRSSFAAACMALLAGILTACSQPTAEEKAASAANPEVLTFSILSAENQQSMEKYWQPFLNDMQAQTGLKVKAYYASNYTSLIEAMRFGQVQVGWFSALPALEATRRANADVIGRIVTAGGEDHYTSVLIVRKGSGITLDNVLACGRRYSMGMGDAKSTSGTLAPMAYLFVPRNITPAECFSNVRSANHQANLFAVANGLVDVATNNSVGLTFAAKDFPREAGKVEVIWSSPALPESSILVRRDLAPEIREKIRQFLLTYGAKPGPDGDRERAVLRGLEYGGFRAADNSYLNPIRLMEASTALAEAKHGGDPAKIAAAQKVYDQVQADITAQGAPR